MRNGLYYFSGMICHSGYTFSKAKQPDAFIADILTIQTDACSSIMILNTRQQKQQKNIPGPGKLSGNTPLKAAAQL